MFRPGHLDIGDPASPKFSECLADEQVLDDQLSQRRVLRVIKLNFHGLLPTPSRPGGYPLYISR